MWLFVFLLEPGATAPAHGVYVTPGHDNPFVCGTVRACCTVLVMCPTMSMVASILFNVILAGNPVGQLPAIWSAPSSRTSPWRCSGTSSPPAPEPPHVPHVLRACGRAERRRPDRDRARVAGEHVSQIRSGAEATRLLGSALLSSAADESDHGGDERHGDDAHDEQLEVLLHDGMPPKK